MKYILLILLCTFSLHGWVCEEGVQDTCPDLSHLEKEIRCNWDTIHCSELSFPKDFLWGVATAAHQIEGNLTNNWTDWETTNKLEPSGIACDSWNRDDIDLIKDLGVNSYRFSVEWSRIEPRENFFDNDALDHYSQLVDKLLSAGITPMITLHHFTEPCWFAAKGGFECEDNIHHFVRYCEEVFKVLGDRVHLWCTINEPGIIVLQSYIRKDFPPGVFAPHRGGTVLGNLLRGHVEVYQALKKLPHGKESMIGLAHNVLIFEPYHTGLLGNIESFVTTRMQKMVTDSVIHFFKTGEYSFEFLPLLLIKPYSSFINFKDERANQSLDFFGINYYCNGLFNILKMDTDYREGDIITDFPYALYPEGLYRVIGKVARLNVPIYITENGCPDGDDPDSRRLISLQRHVKILSDAVRDGFDVRGYFHWSLMDNFEWNRGYTMRFGLYHVDFLTQKRTLRPSGVWYAQTVRRLLQ